MTRRFALNFINWRRQALTNECQRGLNDVRRASVWSEGLLTSPRLVPMLIENQRVGGWVESSVAGKRRERQDRGVSRAGNVLVRAKSRTNPLGKMKQSKR